jgi:hypothetical protein
MLGRRMLIVIVAVALGALPGIATAKLMLQLNVAVPKHVTTHTPITVSGEVNGELGAEFVAVFFSTDRCVRLYASEERLSGNVTATGVGYITAQDEQGPFSMPVRLGKFGKHARWLCVYAYHSGRTAGTTVTDRLVAKKL